MTAIEWLIDRIAEKSVMEKDRYYIPYNSGTIDITHIIEQAKEMEKQMVIDIVEKSRSTGLTAEYLLLTYGSKGSDETKNDSAKCGIIDNVDYWEKTLEYWKAEKEISNIGSTYYGLCCARIGIIEDFFKSIQPINITSSQTEISDEEIEKFASDFYDNNGADEFIIMGAKWYREQLKKKQ